MIKTTKISVSSRAAIKVRDNFFTVEYAEERTVDGDVTEAELLTARKDLWDVCNNEVDAQIQEILSVYK